MAGAQPPCAGARSAGASYASYASCVAGAADALGNPDAPGTRRRAARRDGLYYVLPLSLLMHLALLAWPTPATSIGDATRGRALVATLTEVRSLSATSAQHPGTAAETKRHAAGRVSASTTTPEPVAQAGALSPPPAVRSTHPEPVPVPLTEALPGSSIATLSATAYFAADQLTARPRARGEPVLDAPELTALAASGEVVLTLWIDERGKVAESSIERSDLPEAFVRVARAAFMDLPFVPGEIDGQPVGSVLRIAVRYDDERLASDGGATRETAVEPAT